MLRRTRTAKGLGQRHDFFYFKKWGKGRMAKTALAIALPAIGALWLLGAAVTRNNVPYSAGHLASAHEVIGKNCQACHEPEIKAGFVSIGFRQHVSDKACLNCHQAPKHQNKEQFTPSCASCHIEHVANPHLARTADPTCTQCHADLKVKTGSTLKYVHSVEGFNANHPEFAVLRDNYKDPGTIKLNHQVHMKRDGMVDGKGNHVELQCSDCHRTPAAADRSPWKYGDLKQASMTGTMTAEAHGEEHHHGAGEELHQTPTVPHMVNPGEGRELMMPVNYARNCAQCHTMQFNEHFADSVPHDEPQVVHDFIVKKLTEYVAAHPQVVREPITSGATDTTGHWVRRYMKESSTAGAANTPAEWVKLTTVQAEQLLWRKTCAQCHTMQYSAEATGLPKVAEPQIKVRWFQDAMFSHYAHTGFSCESCHSKTTSSMQTADVLIPSIKTCQDCHRGKPTSYGVAENGCFICHQYHNWKEPRGPMNPDKNIQDLLHGSIVTPHPVPDRPAVAAAVPTGQ